LNHKHYVGIQDQVNVVIKLYQHLLNKQILYGKKVLVWKAIMYYL